MKILVVGAGSIGTRHIENLLALGQEVFAVDTDSTRLKAIEEHLSGGYTSLKEALKLKPDVAFICTYSNNHIAPAIECAKSDCHIFIEKPLSVDLQGVENLLSIVESKKVISMVGCNMRFHPAYISIKDIIDNHPLFVKKLWCGLEFGYYLPFAKTDYMDHYMANRDNGGGILFDVIHELDISKWFLGEPEKVYCTKGILSEMEINTEDFSDILIKFKSGASCNIHLDYLQPGYSRRCKVVCENGTVFWDFTLGKIGVYTTEDDNWLWADSKHDIYYNQMYIDEIKYFLDCISNSKETFNSIKDATLVTKIALAAEKSSKTGNWEYIKN